VGGISQQAKMLKMKREAIRERRRQKLRQKGKKVPAQSRQNYQEKEDGDSGRKELIGARVLKEFPPYGIFEGVIKHIRRKQGAHAQFVYQDGTQHGVVYHVVYEDGDSEDLPLSQVLPLLAQASAAQGQASATPAQTRGDARQNPSNRRESRSRTSCEATSPPHGKGINAQEKKRAADASRRKPPSWGTLKHTPLEQAAAPKSDATPRASAACGSRATAAKQVGCSSARRDVVCRLSAGGMVEVEKEGVYYLCDILEVHL